MHTKMIYNSTAVSNSNLRISMVVASSNRLQRCLYLEKIFTFFMEKVDSFWVHYRLNVVRHRNPIAEIPVPVTHETVHLRQENTYTTNSFTIGYQPDISRARGRGRGRQWECESGRGFEFNGERVDCWGAEGGFMPKKAASFLFVLSILHDSVYCLSL